MEISDIKSKAWVSWCETISAYTSLKDMWTNLRLALGAKCSMPAPHSHPHSEANRLALSFATRCSSSQLPASVSQKLQQVRPTRQHVIQTAIHSSAQRDTPSTLSELVKATTTFKDTAPGIDKIPYFMLYHLGPSSMRALLRLFNASYHKETLPQAWKSANIQLIPKRYSTNTFQPISTFLHWKNHGMCCAPFLTTHYSINPSTYFRLWNRDRYSRYHYPPVLNRWQWQCDCLPRPRESHTKYTCWERSKRQLLQWVKDYLSNTSKIPGTHFWFLLLWKWYTFRRPPQPFSISK